MKRSERLGMRVKAQDKQLWKEAAAAQGKSLSAWIESTLNESAHGKN